MSIRVLLVDAEEQFLETLAQRLMTRGFGVATASSGEEAVAAIEENEYDVVVLDVPLPGKDGLATLQEIKRIKPLIEVLMLATHATVEAAVGGMKRGAYDYLMKPTDTTDLVAKIESAYARKAEQEERIRHAEVDSMVQSKEW